MDPLLKIARLQQREQTLLITFSDSHYLDVLLNWILALDRMEIRNYLIVSLDEQIHAFLTQRGFPSCLKPISGPLGSLWHLRLKVIRELAASGLNVIHSDTDAVWLRNPIPDYFSMATDHLVITQGTICPQDVLMKQGFVLCCGLFYLRSSPEAIALLNRVHEDMTRTNDDQTSLNRVICETVTWDVHLPSVYQFIFRRQRVLCSKDPIQGRSRTDNLSVTLLPHHLFQRVHMPGQPAYVKHLISEKTAGDKLESFGMSGCLFLEKEWRNIEFTADTIGRIAIPNVPPTESHHAP
jgi:hypothetical protein